MSDDQTFHDEIEGYAGRLSYAPGDTVTLHVSTRAAGFDVEVERWGARREPTWAARDLTGRFTSVPDDADAQGCGWPVAAEFPIPDDGRSGFHLVTLTAHDASPGRAVAHAGYPACITCSRSGPKPSSSSC